jgi:hypothetical protein
MYMIYSILIYISFLQIVKKKLKWRQILCPNLFIKKKRVQLINGEPGENYYNKIVNY